MAGTVFWRMGNMFWRLGLGISRHLSVAALYTYSRWNDKFSTITRTLHITQDNPLPQNRINWNSVHPPQRHTALSPCKRNHHNSDTAVTLPSCFSRLRNRSICWNLQLGDCARTEGMGVAYLVSGYMDSFKGIPSSSRIGSSSWRYSSYWPLFSTLYLMPGRLVGEP